MSPAEHSDLDALAKDVSAGTDGRWSPAVYPLLRGAADALSALGWQANRVCALCPRPMHKHTCSCPHMLAKKRLARFGVWPEGK